jgi:nicotinamide-nucleotide amidase
MKAEIIALGSELLTPYHLDTNSLFLTQGLNQAGFEVHLKTIVGDNEEDIIAVLHSALKRSDLIVLSGGLGPTEDDLTRTAVAKVLGRPLALDHGILEELRQRFASRGYRMAKINERQAEVIEGAEVLHNRWGTAPGMWIAERGVHVVLLPGPPREIKPMFEKLVMPRAQQLGGGRRLVHRAFNVSGFTESEVDSVAAPIYTTYSRVQTTILTAPGHIALRFHRWLNPGEEASDLEELSRKIAETLGDSVFTVQDEPLELVVGRLLRDSSTSLAVAESCTGGMIGTLITRIPGSSEYFLGGLTCYSNAAKVSLCDVPEDLIHAHGAVSAPVAEALARGARQKFKAGVGLSVTGIAGPDGGSAEKPVGLVYVGLSGSERTVHFRRIIPGDRDAIRERAAFFSLACLRGFLLPPAVNEKP